MSRPSNLRTRAHPGERTGASLLHWEDFYPGRRFTLGSLTISRTDIVEFAKAWDPQAFHLDARAASQLNLGDVIASGWHTVCVCSRILVTELMNKAANLPGPGVDEIRWPNPVLPGDRIEVFFTVLTSRPSQSRPDQGITKSRLEAINQNGDEVLNLKVTSLLLRRPLARNSPAIPEQAAHPPS